MEWDLTLRHRLGAKVGGGGNDSHFFYGSKGGKGGRAGAANSFPLAACDGTEPRLEGVRGREKWELVGVTGFSALTTHCARGLTADAGCGCAARTMRCDAVRGAAVIAEGDRVCEEWGGKGSAMGGSRQKRELELGGS